MISRGSSEQSMCLVLSAMRFRQGRSCRCARPPASALSAEPGVRRGAFKPAAQEVALRGLGGELERRPVGAGGLACTAELPEQVGPRGVEEVVALETLDALDQLKATLRSLRHRDRHGAVQFN